MGANVPVTPMDSENLFLLHSTILGVYLAFVYDTIRIFRRLISHNIFFISLEDVIYWIYLAAEVLLLMYRESNGMLRWFYGLQAAHIVARSARIL